ncbi:hypothetical protein LINPERHAP1_LOCUS32643 [Linum perenne]
MNLRQRKVIRNQAGSASDKYPVGVAGGVAGAEEPLLLNPFLCALPVEVIAAADLMRVLMMLILICPLFGGKLLLDDNPNSIFFFFFSTELGTERNREMIWMIN